MNANSQSASQFSLLDWGITPWTVLALCLAPLLLLIIFKKVFPTKRLAWLASIPFILALPTPWASAWWWIIPSFAGAVVALIAVGDLFSLPQLSHVHVLRTMTRVASLGNHHTAEFSVDNRGKRPIRIELAEDRSDGLQTEPNIHHLSLQPGKRVTVQHSITRPTVAALFNWKMPTVNYSVSAVFGSDNMYLAAPASCMFTRTSSKLASTHCWRARTG